MTDQESNDRDGRPNLMWLRGYEFEDIVPWEELIGEMEDG